MLGMRKIAAVLSSVLFIVLCLAGCGKSTALNAKRPVTITMWHNFGGQMQQTMDQLVDDFNNSVGRERGVIVSITAISSSADMTEKLDRIVNGDPGASQLPDLFTAYPKTASLFMQKDMLVNLDSYFSSKELTAYLPQFVEEGRLEDGGLYVFPFAKSTEVLFVNQTLFDRFSAETGVELSSLATFEGIARAAEAYYQWTDGKTPQIPNDGKTFYAADSWLNLAQSGMKQLGESLFEDKTANLSADAYRRIWEFAYRPSVQGWYALYEGYSSDLSKTGQIVCSTGSTAGILFYGDSITYPDNTTETVEYTVLPYPVFEGGKKVSIQRGNGFCVAASDPQRELAATLFLKWFTEPEQNMKFISSTGYLPVTKSAFEERMDAEIAEVENPNVKKMLEAAVEMYQEYDFYVAPSFAGFDSLGKSYESTFKQLLGQERERFAADPEQAKLSDSSAAAYQTFAARLSAASPQ